MFCISCGAEISQGNAYCHHCGTAVSPVGGMKDEKKIVEDRARRIDDLLEKINPKRWSRTDEGGREEILNQLRELGQPAFERIIAMSESDSVATREKGVALLGGLGAIEALWLLEDERGENRLIQALEDEDQGVQLAALHSLFLIEEEKKTGKTIPALLDVLQNHKDPGMRAETGLLLAFLKWDPRVLQALIEALNDKGEPEHEADMFGMQDYTKMPMSVRDAASNALRKIGRPAVKHLIEGSQKGERDGRAWAFSLLCEIGDEQAVDFLIDTLREGNPEWQDPIGARGMVVEALGRIRDPKAVDPLALALNDESPRIQKKAWDALRKVGEAAVGPLAQGLIDKSKDRRTEAAKALGETGSTKAVELLIQALSQDEDRWVRSAAAEALAKIGDERAVEPLTQATKDKSWYVRNSVKAALKSMAATSGSRGG